MAKLSARGRKELVRVSKTVALSPEESDLTSQRTYTHALMDDCTILEKVDVVFRRDGKRHSYGWKVLHKVKPEVTVERFVTAHEKAGYARA